MGNTVKTYSLIAALMLLSFAASAQLMPSSTIWGNSKVPMQTSASDSLGYAKLSDLKTYFSQGLAGGTVTSVAATVPTGLSVSGSPITSSGTIAISNNMAAGFVSSSGVGGSLTSSATIAGSAISGNITGNAANVTGTVAVANGGTGATTLTGYLKGNGTSAVTASSTIPTTALSGTITNAQLAGSIDLTTKVTGTLPVANGGSGTSTVTGYLKGNGTSAYTGSSTIPLSDITGATLQAITTNGATSSVATTYSGGLTSSGATATSGGLTATNASGNALTVSGGLVNGTASISSATTLTATSNIVFADATSAAVTVTLPTTPTTGREIKVIRTNTNANNVTITRGGTDTIQGNNSIVVVSPTTVTLRFSGSIWYYEFN